MGRLEVKSSILLCWALTLMYSAAEREYFIQPNNFTWSDARKFCQACFQELVTLTPDNIQNIARKISSDHWIGLRKNFNFNNNSIYNLTSTPASYTVDSFTTQYINFTRNDTSSPFLNWTQWANGDPLAFQNWYPGWPVPKPHPKPPKKTLCCSCSCTCPVSTTTPATTPNTTKITASVTDNATSFTDLIGNTDEITPQSSFTSFKDQTMTTQSTSSSFTTSVPWTTTEMPVQAQCQRTPMVEPAEPEDDDSNDVNYIEDSCVAMLSFGPWIEKNCLDLLPFICYEDRFYGQVSVTNRTFNSANLTWSPAPGNISVYRVEVTEFVNNGKGSYSVIPVTDLTHELTDLTAGTNYSVQVFPEKCGRDLNPENISFYTIPNKVTNLTITVVNESSVSLSWNKPEGNLDFFELTYDSPNSTTKTKFNSTTKGQLVGGLIPGTLYNFTIISGVNDTSTWSDKAWASNYTNPDKVYNLTVSNNTNSSLVVTWVKPNGNYTDITVMVMDINNVTSIMCTVNKNDSDAVTVTDLPSGAEIRINVTVRLIETVTRLGETQNISSYTTPGLISNLTLSSSSTSLNATWIRPNSNYTSFIINIYLDGSIAQSETRVNGTEVSFDKLKNAANYTVEVRTVSGNLTGASVSASIFTLPNKPSNVVATQIGNDSITFLWWPPDNTATPTYAVKLSSSFWGQSWSNQTSGTNYTFSGLKSGTNYSFEVRTMADGLQSDAVSSVNCTVPNKREISLSMLCTSSSPLLCDNPSTRENVFEQLMAYFSQELRYQIFWDLKKTFK